LYTRPIFYLYTIVFTIVRVLVYATIENLCNSYTIACIISVITIVWICVTVCYYTIVCYGM
jgi:hypothetical protein